MKEEPRESTLDDSSWCPRWLTISGGLACNLESHGRDGKVYYVHRVALVDVKATQVDREIIRKSLWRLPGVQITRIRYTTPCL